MEGEGEEMEEVEEMVKEQVGACEDIWGGEGVKDAEVVRER